MAEVTYREALRRALDEELARDESVYLIGEEIGRFEGSYKVTAGLYKKYGPRRVREAPIAEEGFLGVGIGSAMLGLRPVVEIMTINFILVAAVVYFLIVLPYKKLRERGEVEQAQDTELSILTEIRDLLTENGAHEHVTGPGTGPSPDTAKHTSADRT